MERFARLYKDNQAAFAASAAATLMGLGAIVYLKRNANKSPAFLRDPFFEENVLSYSEECAQRAQQLSNVSYQLLLTLNEEQSEGFSGCLKTDFTLSASALAPLYLDFQGQEISQVSVNGKACSLADVRFEKHRIYLPMAQLKENESNTVSLHFKNTYVTNSAGLHYYKDPKDNQVYIYSHLEPFFCHRFFPCFDQPSVKAPLKLTVVSPKSEWKVIGNAAETDRAIEIKSGAG